MKGPKFDNGLSIPRHTDLPPEVLEAMPYMTGAELKVTIAALAYAGMPLPFGELQRVTGLARGSVSSGVKDAIERGTLERVPVQGARGQATYAYGARYNALPRAQMPAKGIDSTGDAAKKGGLIFVPPALLKLSIVIESLKDIDQQYLTIGEGWSKIELDPPPVLSRRKLDAALKSAGVYPAVRRQLLERAAEDTAFGERLVWALVLYPLAQYLGLAEGGGWLVTAITGDWDLPALGEDLLERAQARAEQRAARDSLPEDVLRGLERIGYTSGFAEVAVAYAKDPRRVRGWLLWAADDAETDPEHAAGRFRQALRSGSQPPATAMQWVDFLE